MNMDIIASDNFGKYQPSQVQIAGHINDVIKAIGKKYEPSFNIKTDFDKWLYNNLVYYFTDDERCDWNLSKGLLFHHFRQGACNQWFRAGGGSEGISTR